MAAQRTVVTLVTSKDWKQWIRTIRSSSLQEGIWDLINPEKWSLPNGDHYGLTLYDAGTETELASIPDSTPASSNTIPSQSEEPYRLVRGLRYSKSRQWLIPKPEHPIPSDIISDKHDLADLNETEMRLYNSMRSLYKVEEARFNRKTAILYQMHNRVLETVDAQHHVFIDKCQNAREMLVRLQKRFKPTDEGNKQDIRDRWNELMMSGSKGKALEQWLDECISTYHEGKEVKLAFAEGSEPIRSFILALPRGSQRDHMINKYAELIDDGTTFQFEEIVQKYRNLYKNWIVPSTKKVGGSAFITFNGQTPDGKQEKDTSIGDNQKSGRLQCPCGEEHRFSACPYICSSVRPEGWKRDSAVWKRMEDVFNKKPHVKSIADRAADRDKRQQKKAELGKDEANTKQNAGKFSQGEKKKDGGHVAMLATPYTPSDPDMPSDLDTCDISSDTDTDTWDTCDVSLETDTCESAHQVFASPVFSETSNQLADSFILDSGATVHVCNDVSRFVDFKESKTNVRIAIGDTNTCVKGWGKVLIKAAPVTGDEPLDIVLHNVAYIPGFGCNIVSLWVIMKQGFVWHTLKGMILRNRVPICRVEKHCNMFTMEYNEPRHRVHTAVKRTGRSFKRPESQETMEIWHQRLGHPSFEAVQHLPEATGGVKLTKQSDEEDTIRKCETCRISKAKQKISRVPAERENLPWKKVHFDIIAANPAYNDSTQLLHFYCDATKSHRVVDLKFAKDDSLNTVKEAIFQFIAWVKTQFGYSVKVMQSDLDRALGKEFVDTLTDKGIEWHQAVAYAKEQHGGSERSGRMLIETSRCLHVMSKIPKDLWPASYHCSAYLLNRTPNRGLDWKTPYEVVHERLGTPNKKPYVGHLRIFGTRVYEKIPDEKIPNKDKQAPRALVGYLVSYDGTNQFWVWNPRKGTVAKKRDVTFDEKIQYDPKNPYVEDAIVDAVPRLSTVLDLGISNQPIAREFEFDDTSEDESFIPTPTSGDSTDENVRNDMTDSSDKKSKHVEESRGPYLTPERTPSEDPQASKKAVKQEQGLVRRRKAPRDISLEITEENIIEGPRRRAAKRDRDFIYQTRLNNPQEEEILFAMFTDGLTHRHQRLHRNNLPPEPRSMREAKRHQFKDGWWEAALSEINALSEKTTFRKVTIPKAKQVIPLIWVFRYKLDADGYLIKLKARLCVRGDLQTLTRDDTYAATLASKSFRALMAIGAIFNLDMRQWDAINAFVNSVLDEEVYVRMPDGFEEAGCCWLLLKALYGLRRSPRLWQLEFGSLATD